MKTLRTAVVGLGRIGWQYHIPEIIAHEGFELVAVVDPLQERLDEAKSQYGANGYSSHDDLLKDETLDLVVIASPTQFHAEQTVKALESGRDVFCDKPMALSAQEADTMIAAMESSGRKLMVYQPHRAFAPVVTLQHILKEDLIGPIYMMKQSRCNYTRRDDWQAFRKHGGGMLRNFGAHVIDQLLFLAGSRASRVSCSMRTIASLGDAEDVVKAVIETENGIILDVDINMAAAQRIPGWHILGKNGSITMAPGGKEWLVRFYAEEKLADVHAQKGLAAEDRRYRLPEKIPWEEKRVPCDSFPAIDYYEQCYAYYAEDKEPFVPIQESRELTRVLDLCREAAG